MNTPRTTFSIVECSKAIRAIHEEFEARSLRAVNVGLTLRNWVIGDYILVFEQQGSRRAGYGDALLDRLAAKLETLGVPRTDPRELRRYRQFRLEYPGIRESLTPELKARLPYLSAAEKRESLTPGSREHMRRLLEGLSFTHFGLLLQVEQGPRRRFYEEGCLSGQWSVRELRRQISSLVFERSELSSTATPQKPSKLRGGPSVSIRDPYVFEFLGLKPAEVLSESKLEDRLLDKVQEFILELGRGFCFEARQKRIRIGEENYFVDLVFYHRILKCHVLLELKVDEFRHEHLGQLNTYVNWFRKHEMTQHDNPPIGLLLCTSKNQALMEYALAGMDNRIFVSRYQLALPRKDELEHLIQEGMEDWESCQTALPNPGQKAKPKKTTRAKR